MATNNHLSDVDSIRNVLATYCIALDTKSWELLTRVFTPTVHANYPSAVFIGVKPIAEEMKYRLEHVASQHALTTQTALLADDGQRAKVRSYFTATHFGHGRWMGWKQVVWGEFVDDLVKVDAYGIEGGAREGEVGRWRVRRRICRVVGQEGEERIMDGDVGGLE